jgi:hypothetical protein
MDTLTGVGARTVVERMGEALAKFLATLAADQRRKAVMAFDDQAERTNWHFTPIARKGLPLTEMTRDQQRLALQAVSTGLSRAGYVTASTIMGLETTLDAKENWSWPERGRDPQLYYLSVFGEPHAEDPWGWRFEGHHISLNYTIVKGQIVAPTPTFFGANPAEAPLGGVATLRPLSGVEDLARELLHTFNDEQRATAILAPVAPADIVMRNRPYVVSGALHLDDPDQIHKWMHESGITHEQVEALRYTKRAQGVAAAAMQASQHEILQMLIREYIHRMPDELAEIEWQALQQRGLSSVHFSWAGGTERYQPHYYRLQGERFLVEYDNTQNDANHIHSVWRDPANDFGADLLAHHYHHEH